MELDLPQHTFMYNFHGHECCFGFLVTSLSHAASALFSPHFQDYRDVCRKESVMMHDDTGRGRSEVISLMIRTPVSLCWTSDSYLPLPHIIHFVPINSRFHLSSLSHSLSRKPKSILASELKMGALRFLLISTFISCLLRCHQSHLVPT